MIIHNWFSHTTTAPPTACRRVNQHLAAYAGAVRDHARTYLGNAASVCLSGSLARGEPAVRRHCGDYVLASDVDLVAVVDEPSEAAAPRVEKFARALLETHPDIDSTVFAVHRPDLCRVAGRFGADLHHGADNPMAGLVPDGVAAPQIGRREGLEGLTHQLATIYCPDSPPGASPWRIKTALEALRAIAAPAAAAGPQRYSGLVDDPTVRTVLDRDTVTELVCARERSAPMPLTDARSYELVITAACHLFGVPATHPDLLATLHTRLGGVHLLDGFQRAVLAATIILYGPPRFRRAAAAALHVTVSTIDHATVPTALSSLDALERISPVDFSRGIDHPNHVLRGHLQGLRRDYYHHLGPHNFGAHPVADYTGPTVAGSTAGSIAHG
ncbi:hypothetical protein [Nocardia rhamnosiphila]